MSGKVSLREELKIAQRDAESIAARLDPKFPRLPKDQLELQVALSTVESRIASVRNALSIGAQS